MNNQGKIVEILNQCDAVINDPTDIAQAISAINSYHFLQSRNRKLKPIEPYREREDKIFTKATLSETGLSKIHEIKVFLQDYQKSSNIHFVKFALCIFGCILLALTGLLFFNIDYFNHSRTEKRTLALAQSILDEANQINLDSANILGSINAVIENYNTFCKKTEDHTATINKLNDIYDQDIYYKVKDTGRERLNDIRIKLKSYINGSDMGKTNPSNNAILSLIGRIIGMICEIGSFVCAILGFLTNKKQLSLMQASQR